MRHLRTKLTLRVKHDTHDTHVKHISKTFPNHFQNKHISPAWQLANLCASMRRNIIYIYAMALWIIFCELLFVKTGRITPVKGKPCWNRCNGWDCQVDVETCCYLTKHSTQPPSEAVLAPPLERTHAPLNSTLWPRSLVDRNTTFVSTLSHSPSQISCF